MIQKIAVLVLCLCLIGCGCPECFVQGYYKCDNCGAAYRTEWGLPGMVSDKMTGCRFCNVGNLHKCSKEHSGWKD